MLFPACHAGGREFESRPSRHFKSRKLKHLRLFFVSTLRVKPSIHAVCGVAMPSRTPANPLFYGSTPKVEEDRDILVFDFIGLLRIPHNLRYLAFFIAEFSDWHFIKKCSEPNQMIWLCIKNRK